MAAATSHSPLMTNYVTGSDPSLYSDSSVSVSEFSLNNNNNQEPDPDPFPPNYSKKRAGFSMVDVKDDMTNNDTEAFGAANAADPKNVQELTQYVQSLLQTIQDKFQNMSDQILTRIDEMGTRIDDLEKNIGDLMTQAGVEAPDK